MADFDNLLGEIDAIDDDETVDIALISQQDDTSSAIETVTDPTTTTMSIPPALLEAENYQSLHRPTLPNNSNNNDQDQDYDPTTQNPNDPLGEYDYHHEDEIDNDEDEEDEDEEDGRCRPDHDYEKLRRLWIQELNCNEILPYDDNVTSVLLEVLADQDDTMDQLQEQAGMFSAATGAGAAGGRSGKVDPSLASLAAGICKMDSDRLGFVMADLMRARLFKIEKYALHNREMLDRMSDSEVSYLRNYGLLLEQHMQRSVTDHITKDAWKKLDEPEMIERPNLDSYVFCRVIVDKVTLNNQLGMELTSGAEVDEEDEDGGGDMMEETFPDGSQIFVRYAVIRQLLLEGKVELLM